MNKKLILSLLLLMSFTVVFAQAENKVEMADILRSSGKIYVVVATIAVVFIGIVLFLINIDRKITRLEKGNK